MTGAAGQVSRPETVIEASGLASGYGGRGVGARAGLPGGAGGAQNCRDGCGGGERGSGGIGSLGARSRSGRGGKPGARGARRGAGGGGIGRHEVDRRRDPRSDPGRPVLLPVAGVDDRAFDPCDRGLQHVR